MPRFEEQEYDRPKGRRPDIPPDDGMDKVDDQASVVEHPKSPERKKKRSRPASGEDFRASLGDFNSNRAALEAVKARLAAAGNGSGSPDSPRGSSDSPGGNNPEGGGGGGNDDKKKKGSYLDFDMAFREELGKHLPDEMFNPPAADKTGTDSRFVQPARREQPTKKRVEEKPREPVAEPREKGPLPVSLQTLAELAEGSVLITDQGTRLTVTRVDRGKDNRITEVAYQFDDDDSYHTASIEGLRKSLGRFKYIVPSSEAAYAVIQREFPDRAVTAVKVFKGHIASRQKDAVSASGNAEIPPGSFGPDFDEAAGGPQLESAEPTEASDELVEQLKTIAAGDWLLSSDGERYQVERPWEKVPESDEWIITLTHGEGAPEEFSVDQFSNTFKAGLSVEKAPIDTAADTSSAGATHEKAAEEVQPAEAGPVVPAAEPAALTVEGTVPSERPSEAAPVATPAEVPPRGFADDTAPFEATPGAVVTEPQQGEVERVGPDSTPQPIEGAEAPRDDAERGVPEAAEPADAIPVDAAEPRSDDAVRVEAGAPDQPVDAGVLLDDTERPAPSPPPRRDDVPPIARDNVDSGRRVTSGSAEDEETTGRKKERGRKLTDEEKSELETRQGFQKFGILSTDLERISGYEQLSVGQRAVLLKNFTQLVAARVEEEAGEEHRQQTLEKVQSTQQRRTLHLSEIATLRSEGGMSRVRSFGERNFVRVAAMTAVAWQYLKGEYSKQEALTRSLRELTSGGIAAHRETLQTLVGGMREYGPDVELRNGKPLTRFAREEDFGENVSEIVEDAVDHFNSSAYEYSRLTDDELSSESRKTRATIQAYEQARDALLRLRTQPGGETAAQLYMNAAESRVNAQRFLATHPDAEATIRSIASRRAWYRAAKSIVKERWMYLALGGLSRTLASKWVSFMAAPLVGGAIGARRGVIQGRRELHERDVLARRGVKDTSETALNVVEASGHRFKEDEEEDDVIPYESGLSGKIHHLIRRIEAEPGTSRGRPLDKLEFGNERLLDSLEVRLKYTERKLNRGLVDFGKTPERVVNHYKLVRALSEGRAALAAASAERGVRTGMHASYVQRELNAVLARREAAIGKKRSEKIRSDMWRGARRGATYAIAGYYLIGPMFRKAVEATGLDEVASDAARKVIEKIEGLVKSGATPEEIGEAAAPLAEHPIEAPKITTPVIPEPESLEMVEEPAVEPEVEMVSPKPIEALTPKVPPVDTLGAGELESVETPEQGVGVLAPVMPEEPQMTHGDWRMNLPRDPGTESELRVDPATGKFYSIPGQVEKVAQEIFDEMPGAKPAPGEPTTPVGDEYLKYDETQAEKGTAEVQKETLGARLAAVAAEEAPEPTAEGYVETARPGDSVWSMAERQLQRLFKGDWDKIRGGDAEREAIQTYLIDAVKDEVAKNPAQFGLEDVDKVAVGQTIDFERILTDHERFERVVDRIEALTPEEKANILESNARLRDWSHEHPTEQLTSEKAEHISKGISEDEVEAEAEAPHRHEPGVPAEALSSAQTEALANAPLASYEPREDVHVDPAATDVMARNSIQFDQQHYAFKSVAANGVETEIRLSQFENQDNFGRVEVAAADADQLLVRVFHKDNPSYYDEILLYPDLTWEEAEFHPTPETSALLAELHGHTQLERGVFHRLADFNRKVGLIESRNTGFSRKLHHVLESISARNVGSPKGLRLHLMEELEMSKGDAKDIAKPLYFIFHGMQMKLRLALSDSTSIEDILKQLPSAETSASAGHHDGIPPRPPAGY